MLQIRLGLSDFEYVEWEVSISNGVIILEWS